MPALSIPVVGKILRHARQPSRQGNRLPELIEIQVCPQKNLLRQILCRLTMPKPGVGNSINYAKMPLGDLRESLAVSSPRRQDQFIIRRRYCIQCHWRNHLLPRDTFLETAGIVPSIY